MYDSQAQKICKIAASGSSFTALSSLGDVFNITISTADKQVKPQLVWALRRRATAVRDMWLGSDGAMILCTDSGHVFIRSRKGKQLKFVKVPGLQRIVRVFTNESGSFGALRVDAACLPIAGVIQNLADDMAQMQPHLRRMGMEKHQLAEELELDRLRIEDEDDYEEDEDALVENDVRLLSRICSAVERWDGSVESESVDWALPALGTDMFVVTSSGHQRIPAHRTILSARSPVLNHLLTQSSLSDSGFRWSKSSSELILPPCSHLTALLLMHYLYSDSILAIWDPRIHPRIRSLHPTLPLSISDIKRDLQSLAKTLDLPYLSTSLESVTRRQPTPSLASHLFSIGNTCYADVLIQFSDHTLESHSSILRARCAFFAAFFDDPDWTAERKIAQGDTAIVEIDMRHWNWDVMQFVFRWIYAGGTAEEVFETLGERGSSSFGT